MKKIIAVFVISLFALNIGAQDLDEILNAHFENAGQENLLDIDAFRIKAKVHQGGMELPMVLYQKRPHMFKSEVEVQGQKIISAYDGENGWMINPMMGSTDPIPLTGEQLKQAQERADIDGKLYNWKEKGHKVEYSGTEEMEGTEVYVISMKTKEGDEITYYLDVDSYLILKEKTTTTVQGGEQEVESLFTNYKQVDGIAFPGAIVVKMGGNVVTELVFEEIETNAEIDDSEFEMPTVEKKEKPAPGEKPE